MPLPKAPSKRADMLSEVDFTSQPKPVTKTTKGKAPKVPPAAPRVSLPPLLEVVSRTPAANLQTAAPSALPRTKPASAPALPPVAQPIVAERLAEAPARTETPAKVAPAAKPVKGGTSRRKKDAGPAKLFVLDTNVLLHDPMSLFRLRNTTSTCP